MMRDLPRVHLVHGPTPLVKRKALDALLGVDLVIKRDDATSGAESGNKVRKLEFLLGDAVGRGATTVLTCGGLQSNHARATAIACAELGLRCVLFLRVADERANDPHAVTPAEALPRVGNVLLDRLVGAEIRYISRSLYADRNAVMEQAAAALRLDGERPYIVPEGGSNGLGSFGYVDAMREVRQQLDAGLGGGPAKFDVVVHACGSGGTAAGVALGAADAGVAREIMPVAVCDSAAYFEAAIARITAEARRLAPELGDPAPLAVDESARGPGYGIMGEAQRKTLVQIARISGVILDPVYTGKAFVGLANAIERGAIARGSRVLFLHTGGLPGLLAQGDAFEHDL